MSFLPIIIILPIAYILLNIDKLMTLNRPSPKPTQHDQVFFEKYEALKWIQSNPNDSPFAGNRFTKETALKFVRKLYRLGAVHVAVDNIFDEPHRIKSDGGPYADSLVVLLPHSSKRLDIIELYRAEAIREGLIDPDQTVDDTIDDELIFWWD